MAPLSFRRLVLSISFQRHSALPSKPPLHLFVRPSEQTLRLYIWLETKTPLTLTSALQSNFQSHSQLCGRFLHLHFQAKVPSPHTNLKKALTFLSENNGRRSS